MLERAAAADTLAHRMQRHLSPLLAPLIVAVALAAGCSSFRGDARLARVNPPKPESVEGLWEGRWYDLNKPEHGGRLQCVLTREGDTFYRLSSRSRWWRIFTSSYDSTVVLTPVEPGVHLVQGGKSLWLWGDYSMTGRVDATRFDARYTIGGHQGVMELYRPGTAPAAAVEPTTPADQQEQPAN